MASFATRLTWTDDEHARFLEAMELYPHGSWGQRAAHVGTRTTRQVMTHAHKIALRSERHARGLGKAGRSAEVTGLHDATTSERLPRSHHSD